MKRSGTNPTAAGVGLLQILGELDDADRDATARLPRRAAVALRGRAARQRPHPGGRPALDVHRRLDARPTRARPDGSTGSRCASYAEECERPIGGFRGGLWDEQADVEYTFYGLGTLALAALMLE